MGDFLNFCNNNKILIYKSIIRSIWTYGSEIWATTAISNLKPIEVMQNKILRRISNANWFITNEDIMKDLKVESVSTEIAKRSKEIICIKTKISANSHMMTKAIHTEDYIDSGHLN